MSQTMTFDERSWLAWLVKVRVIVLTLLVGIELAITRLTPSAVPERLFVGVVILWYSLALFFILLLSFWRETRIQSMVQLLCDLAMVTLVVYITGGVDSSFNFLFPMIIVVAAILLPRTRTYLMAALASVLYGAVVECAYFEVIPSYSTSHPALNTLQAILSINLLAYLAIAYLASQLSTKLRQVDTKLQDTSGALENLQALHENVIRSVNSGLLTTDLEGRITLANPASSRLLEISEDRLHGRWIAELFEDRLPMAASGEAEGEVRALTPGGETKIFSVAVSPLVVPDRGPVGWVYALDDLTEIRRLEREVRLKDRLAAVGRLAAGIAHEIRNPLTSIAGSVHVLSGISALSDEQRLLVQIVTRESDRLNNIISDFLAYAREKRYQFEEQDLLPLLQDTLTLIENSKPAGIRIVREFQPARACSPVDGDKIKQVLWNLCSNALRAMPGGGTLRVSLRGAGADWIIGIADSGRGIPPQQVEKLFEPFQSKFDGGTGLGLAIVYQIVQAHDGKISVRSVPEKGTEFMLHLRRAPAADHASSAKSQRGSAPADAVPAAANAAAAGGTTTHG
jgi:two-component system sensor histidine kinase PilS (NtrC family)